MPVELYDPNSTDQRTRIVPDAEAVVLQARGWLPVPGGGGVVDPVALAANPAFTATYGQKADVAANTAALGSLPDKYEARSLVTATTPVPDAQAYLDAATPLGIKRLIGTLSLDRPLILRSDTYYDFSRATFTRAAGYNGNLLQNRAYKTIQRALTGVVTTASSTTVTCSTGAFTPADVGRAIVIAGASAGAVAGNLCVNIVSVTSGTEVVVSSPAGKAVSSANATIYDRDRRIRLVGGNWESGANNPSVAGPDFHHLLFRRVDGLSVTDVTLTSTAGKYAINAADITDAIFNRNRFPGHSSDGIHINGPARYVAINDTMGACGDDIVSLTARDYAHYEDCLGPITDVKVDGVYGSCPQSGVRVLGAGGGICDRIGIDQVFAQDCAVAISIGDGNLTDCAVGTVTGDAIHGRTRILAGTLESLVLERVVYTPKAANEGVIVVKGTTVRHLSVNGANANTTLTGFNLVQIQDAATIERLHLDDVHWIAPAGFVVSATVSGGGSRVTEMRMSRTYQTGGASSGGLFSTVNLAALGDVYLSDCSTLLSAWIGVLNSTTTVHMHGVRCRGLFQVGAAGVLTIRGSDITSVNGTLTITAGGTVTSYAQDFPADVSVLQKVAGAKATNTNSAVAGGLGPVVSDGSVWRNLATGTAA